MSGRALVLAAHGSRRNPAANALGRRLAEAVRGRRIYDEVAVAFHQGEPTFATVLDELESEEVTVVPFLTSAGYYTETVLPEALSRNRRFAELRLRQTPPVGTHSGIAPLVARQLAALLRENGIARGSVSVVLVGHGTRRHSSSRDTTLQLAGTLRRRRVAAEVLAAFLDDTPAIETVLGAASLPHIVVVPFLIGGGSHVSEDIPRLLGSERAGAHKLILGQPIGSYPGLVDIVIDLARRHPPPPGPRFRFRGGRPACRAVGTVHLVGGGPGDPGLITVRGLDLLGSAEVVVHDRLIGPGLLGAARTDALMIDAGKGPGHAPYSQQEINALLVEHALAGKTVVRLKGGDPFVFGRGSEEAAACRQAGVPVRVVPGITSAIAAPAAAGIPVTARGIAGSFAVVTGHSAAVPKSHPAFTDLPVLPGSTLVVLMGRASLARLAAQLIAAGRDPGTPAACIQSATLPEQRVTRATLATIAEAVDRDGLEAPVVTVIGEVAALDVSGTAERMPSGQVESDPVLSASQRFQLYGGSVIGRRVLAGTTANF
ncbi:MAG: uroporphyrinogen-III C-methyltransferase [Gemmatimonadales bacterium]